jgi:chemotaxis protein CheX
LEAFEVAAEGGQPVIGEIHLLEPFIAATRAAVGEMAATEVVVRGMVRKVMQHALGDIAAIIGLSKAGSPPNAAPPEFLVLGFPQSTAAALAGRILKGTTIQMDQKLIGDCMGEITNVVAGQAKAMLAETPYRFAFTLPPAVTDAGEFRAPQGLDCLVVSFTSDHGEFALQLFLDPCSLR